MAQNATPYTRAIAVIMAFALTTCALPGIAFAGSEVFAVTSDPHVRFQGDDRLVKNNADFKHALQWIKTNVQKAKAVVFAGDIVDRGFAGDFTAYERIWKKSKITADRIQCMGNHETNNAGKLSGLNVNQCTNRFKQVNNGKITSYQQYRNANIMTIGGPYTKSGNWVYTTGMLKTLKKRLGETARQGKAAIVVCHYPYQKKFKNQQQLVRILKSYPNVIYISGDRHYYKKSQWFEIVKPAAKGTAKYGFTSLGLDSICRNHKVKRVWKSKGQSIVSSLRITDTGKIIFKRYDLKTGQKVKTWTAQLLQGKVTIKAASSTAKKTDKLTYKIVFSDGRTYGGVSSGGTFKIAAGKSKTFRGIPFGVKVTVRCVEAPEGWTKPTKAQRIVVAAAKQEIVVKHKYRAKVASTKATTTNAKQVSAPGKTITVVTVPANEAPAVKNSVAEPPAVEACDTAAPEPEAPEAAAPASEATDITAATAAKPDTIAPATEDSAVAECAAKEEAVVSEPSEPATEAPANDAMDAAANGEPETAAPIKDTAPDEGSTDTPESPVEGVGEADTSTLEQD